MPAVDFLSPSAGPIAGGTTVTITGTGLANATAVYFGVHRGDDRQRHRHPDRGDQSGDDAGTVDVTVVTAGGTSAILAADQFTYVAMPAVTSISPGDGAGGGRHVGDDHRHGPGQRHGRDVRGTTAAPSSVTPTPKSWSPVRRALPAQVDVTVVTAGGTSRHSSADQFTYVAAPTVTAHQSHVRVWRGRHDGDDHRHEPGRRHGREVRQRRGHDRQTVSRPPRSWSRVRRAAACTVDVTVMTAGGTSAISTADQFTYVRAGARR